MHPGLSTPSWPRLYNHVEIGCSTGLNAELRGDWDALSEWAVEWSTIVTELSALSEPELPGLVDWLAQAPPLPFEYLSAHAPTKDRAMPERDFVDLLLQLASDVDAVVVHPDVIDDRTLYRELGRKLLIENMDARKQVGQTADDLDEFFEELPEAGLCFDIAHAWSIDPSMDEGRRLLDRHASRLRHVHLSSLDAGHHHVPLTDEHEKLFGPLLSRCRDVPWVLEAVRPQR